MAEEAGAPIVNIPGGEPMIHKQIDEIVNGITAQGRFVYMCTNGLLMNRAFGRIPPTYALRVRRAHRRHARGARQGGRPRRRVRQGHGATCARRSSSATACAPTPRSTAASTAEEYVELFRVPQGHGRRGLHHGAGLRLRVGDARPRAVPRAQGVAGAVLAGARPLRPTWTSPSTTTRSSTSSCRASASYRCTAWAMPTYTVEGWRSPCYLLADKHVGSLKRAVRRDRLGRVRHRPRPALRELPHALRLRGEHDPRRVHEPARPGDAGALVIAVVCAVPAERRALAGLAGPELRVHLSGMGAGRRRAHRGRRWPGGAARP